MKFRCDIVALENNLLIGRHVHECTFFDINSNARGGVNNRNS